VIAPGAAESKTLLWPWPLATMGECRGLVFTLAICQRVLQERGSLARLLLLRTSHEGKSPLFFERELQVDILVGLNSNQISQNWTVAGSR
jgi:hypothetical protein